MSRVDILSKFHERVGPIGPNKQVDLVKKSKNANRVDSFIWHLRVTRHNLIDAKY